MVLVGFEGFEKTSRNVFALQIADDEFQYLSAEPLSVKHSPAFDQEQPNMQICL
jgi:hypothetical protein